MACVRRELFSNRLTGTIPTSLGNLAALIYMLVVRIVRAAAAYSP